MENKRAWIWAWFAAGVALTIASASASAAARWPLWEGFAAAFIDHQGRVIDHQAGDRTTSEGQAYGLFFALVANDRERFGRLFHWTVNNLAQGDLGTHLPGWLWGRSPVGEWKLLDPNPAADADIWIAYTLCEAGRLWHQPEYDALGRALMAQIAAKEVVELPGFGAMLLPGVSGFHPTDQSWLLNPSYLPLPLFARMAALDPTGPWLKIAAKIPGLVEKSARNGFAMDWVSYSAKAGFQPASKPNSTEPAGGSYDAIRVYLWAGLTDSETIGRAKLLQALPGMADYLASHAVPPEHVDKAGKPATGSAPVGFSAALLPYLQGIGAKATLAAQNKRVAGLLDPASHLYGRPPTYYDGCLSLFGEGGMEQWFTFGTAGQLLVRWGKN